MGPEVVPPAPPPHQPVRAGGDITTFAKTKLCKFHLLDICSKGHLCPFAHGPRELRPLPDLSRTKLCLRLRTAGECTDPNCRYAHHKGELRSDPVRKEKLCRFWLSGGCSFGASCPFAHGRPSGFPSSSTAALPAAEPTWQQWRQAQGTEAVESWAQWREAAPSGPGMGQVAGREAPGGHDALWHQVATSQSHPLCPRWRDAYPGSVGQDALGGHADDNSVEAKHINISGTLAQLTAKFQEGQRQESAPQPEEWQVAAPAEQDGLGGREGVNPLDSEQLGLSEILAQLTAKYTQDKNDKLESRSDVRQVAALEPRALSPGPGRAVEEASEGHKVTASEAHPSRPWQCAGPRPAEQETLGGHEAEEFEPRPLRPWRAAGPWRASGPPSAEPGADASVERRPWRAKGPWRSARPHPAEQEASGGGNVMAWDSSRKLSDGGIKHGGSLQLDAWPMKSSAIISTETEPDPEPTTTRLKCASADASIAVAPEVPAATALHDVTVKNTFLEFGLGQRPSGLRSVSSCGARLCDLGGQVMQEQ